MLKPNKVNLARQLRAAPVETGAERSRSWIIPLAALALLLAALAVYTWGMGARLARERDMLAAYLDSPQTQADYRAAVADADRAAAYGALSALLDAQDSAPVYDATLHRQLQAAAARCGAAVERLDFEQAGGALALACTGPGAGTAAALAALLEELPGLVAVTYDGYSRVGDRYAFTLTCSVEGGAARAQ